MQTANTSASYVKLGTVQLTCGSNNEVHCGVGCAGEGDDVVDPEVAEGGNEGHGA